MRRIPTMATAVVLVLACGACQPLPDASLAAPTAGPPQPAPTASAQPPGVQPSCTSYTVPVTVGGQQADGSWRITQTTPGLPPQVYEVPPPAYSPYPSAYPYPDFSPSWDWAGAPYWGWGDAPWFFGLAPSIVVVQRFNHFHHGFSHGFGHGFAHHGFGHGFAAGHGGGMAGGHR
jgi:hypothetical protein